jgi:hypothetical protein
LPPPRRAQQIKDNVSESFAKVSRFSCSSLSAAGGNAGEKAEPGVHPVMHLQDGGRIGASAEESRMSEGILTAIAAENVPTLTGERNHQRDNEEIEHDVRLHDQGHGGERCDDDHDG